MGLWEWIARERDQFKKEWPDREEDYCDPLEIVTCEKCKRVFEIYTETTPLLCEFCTEDAKQDELEAIAAKAEEIEIAIAQYKDNRREMLEEGFRPSQIAPMPLVRCSVCGGKVDAEVYVTVYKCSGCPECCSNKGQAIDIKV